MSGSDGGVLVVGLACTIWAGRQTWWWGLVIGFVMAHFFLFCNVFRISRILELIWAVVFVSLAGSTIVQQSPGWGPTIVISLVVSLTLIGLEISKPSYHGIGWRTLNPNLGEWWKRHVSIARHQNEIQGKMVL